MPIRGSKVLAWAPAGVCDSLDSTRTGPGGMASLANLVPDPTTRNLYAPRPAAIQVTGFTAPGLGAIVVFYILGDIVYGMIGQSNGYDYPFIYNLDTQVFSFPAGITTSNVPATQSIVGDWTPPTMDNLGAYIIVTHPGFTGAANGFFGWFDLTNPSAPVWKSGNTKINPLVAVPTACAQFGGRIYFAVGNATPATDEFNPLQITNANQVLTFGGSNPITALAGLGLNNQVSGGIVQSLMVFKGVENIWQVTGDYTGTPSPWSVNTLNVATGTLAPNAVTPTPGGLAFVAPEGIRTMDFNANISKPLGMFGKGVSVPFQNAVAPSRMCAAYNVETLRVAVRLSATQASLPNGQGTVEYWYNFTLGEWTGPHSLPTIFIRPYKSTFFGSMVPYAA